MEFIKRVNIGDFEDSLKSINSLSLVDIAQEFCIKIEPKVRKMRKTYRKYYKFFKKEGIAYGTKNR